MRKIFFSLGLSLRELLRQPTYVVTTMLFPSMFFWFFGVPNATTVDSAKLLTASFSAFAVMGVVLFQLAVQTAHERSSNWNRYLRTLPISLPEVLFFRVVASVLLSFFSVALVVGTGLFFTGLRFSDVPWLPLVGALAVGGLPFLLLGLCLGYSIQGKSIVPVANLVYLPLSFAGGLWMPPNILPKAVQDLSEWLPTRWYGELVWNAMFLRENPQGLWLKIAALVVGLAVLFFFLYRREQQR